MATWGSQTWGFANWGTLGDATVTLSGVQLNSQQGSVDQGSNPGWGAQYWGAGEWGDLSSPEILVTGNALTTSITSVAAGTNFAFQATGVQLNTTVGNAVSGISQLIIPTTLITTTSVTSVFAGELVEVQVTTATADQWGSDVWGQGSWGVGDGLSTQVGVSGVEAGATVVIANDNTKIIHTGSAVAGASAEVPTTGIEITSELGQEFAGPNVEVQVTSPSNDPWGEEAYGEGAWGVGDGISISLGSTTPRGNAIVQVTAVTALSISEGTVDPAPDAEVTGIGMAITSGVGTVTAFANTDITGIQINSTVDNASTTGDANIDVTGQQIIGNTGQLEYEATYTLSGEQSALSAGTAFGGELVEVQVTTASTQPWGEVAWGDGQWGQSVGTDIGIGGEEVAVPSVEVAVTGEELSSDTGDEVVTGTANITLTGIEINTQLGDEDAFTNVRINVSGNDIGTIVIGDYLAGISAEAQPSGVTMASSSGTIGLNAWELVDPGTAPTWTVVDKAA
jgi:hypothetical protein